MIARIVEVLKLKVAGNAVVADSERVEETNPNASITVTWNSTKRPHGFKQIGDEVAYIQTSASLKTSRNRGVKLDDAGEAHYAWRDTAHQELMILIVIIPEGFGLDLEALTPPPTRAKIFGKKLAVYWELNPEQHEIGWKQVAASESDLAEMVQRINKAALFSHTIRDSDTEPSAESQDEGQITTMFNQYKLIEIARKSVPGFNWAIGGAALVALAAIVMNGGANVGTLVLFVGFIILLMVTLFLFHRLSNLDPKKTSLMAVVMSWTVLILLLLSFVCLFSSSVVNWPWPIRDWIGRQLDGATETSRNAVSRWVKVATEARTSKSVSKGRPIPTTVSDARAQFEKWWFDTPLTARKGGSHPDLFSALSLNIRIYRLQETEDTTKASSFRWADEAIGFFEEAGDQKYLAEALLEKAAVFLDLSDLRHANPEEFARVAKDGEATMKRASELAVPEQKSEALRLWSRFYYNLARPKDGNLTEDWNNNFLLVSYDRMRDAYSADPNQLNNVVQLARATQKTAANPPQDASKDWTQRLWEAQRLIKGKWQEQSGTVADSRSRISPLNILGVITMDAVLRSWMEAPPTSRQESAGPLIEALDKTALPAQRDTLALVLGTELEKDYAFDIYYDLARMHAVRLLVAESGGRIDPDGDFAAVVTNIEAARKAGRDTQRQAAIDSITKYPCFSLLSEERRRVLLKALGSV